MEKGKSYLKPRWWRKVRRAYEELGEETNNFTTKKNIDLEDVQTDRYKLIALRLISGWNTEDTALYIDLPFQTLLKWESGKARMSLPPNTAEKMVLRSNFQDFKKHGPTNPLITRFFKECSLLDMKKNFVTRRRMNTASGIAILSMFAFFVLIFFSGVLGISTLYGLVGSFVFLMVVAFTSAVLSPRNPLMPGSIEEELVYANRFILVRDQATREWAKRLLDRASKMIRFRGKQLPELQDVKELYEAIAESVRSKLVPRAEDFENLGERKKAVFINTVRTLAEHFFSPNLKSTSSLQMIFPDLDLEFPERLPEARKERRVAESIERLDRKLYYESSIGRMAIDSIIIICVAFDITFLSWIPMGLDVLAGVGLFGAVSFVFVSLRIAHLRGR